MRRDIGGLPAAPGVFSDAPAESGARWRSDPPGEAAIVKQGARPGQLRALREAHGLNALEWATRVGCSVGTVVRAEMGLQVPRRPADRARMAAAYGLSIRDFVRMALDAAEQHERHG